MKDRGEGRMRTEGAGEDGEGTGGHGPAACLQPEMSPYNRELREGR